jgi:nucleoside-diphosphate-sugar epimerase
LTEIRRALVTGASGFIGAHCVRFLADRHWRVRALDVHPAPNDFKSLEVEFTQADLRDSPTLTALLQGVDVVFHLASVHLDVGASYAEFEAVNVGAVAALVAACLWHRLSADGKADRRAAPGALFLYRRREESAPPGVYR